MAIVVCMSIPILCCYQKAMLRDDVTYALFLLMATNLQRCFEQVTAIMKSITATDTMRTPATTTPPIIPILLVESAVVSSRQK